MARANYFKCATIMAEIYWNLEQGQQSGPPETPLSRPRNLFIALF